QPWKGCLQEGPLGEKIDHVFPGGRSPLDLSELRGMVRERTGNQVLRVSLEKPNHLLRHLVVHRRLGVLEGVGGEDAKRVRTHGTEKNDRFVEGRVVLEARHLTLPTSRLHRANCRNNRMTSALHGNGGIGNGTPGGRASPRAAAAGRAPGSISR